MRKPKYLRIEKILITVLIWVLISACALWFGRNDPSTIAFTTVFNGYLSPLISLLAAFLVYISFREQIKANRMLQAQWAFDMHLRMFDDIKRSIENIKIGYNPGGSVWTEFRAKEAFQYIANISPKNPHHIQGAFEAFRNLEPPMREFFRLAERITSSDFEDSDFLAYKICLYYESDLSPLLDIVVKYFEDNKNKVETIKANEVLTITINLVQKKMLELKERISYGI